jgi:hypothetical protein
LICYDYRDNCFGASSGVVIAAKGFYTYRYQSIQGGGARKKCVFITSMASAPVFVLLSVDL